MSTLPPPSGPPSLFVSSRIASRIVDAAVARGAARHEICAAAQIDPRDLDDVDARVDAARYYALWGAAVRAVGDDDAFPLAVAETWSSSHNLLRFICMSSENLGRAFERASRYLRVLTDVVSWPLEQRGDCLVVGFRRAGAAPPPEARFAEAFGAAELALLARGFTGADVRPVEVRFSAPEPAQASVFRAFFRAPVHFGCERSELHVEVAALELPLLKADPAMVSFFEPYIAKILRVDAGNVQRTLADHVREVIGRSLRGDAPGLDEVAAELETSGRTLRRRLSLEGHTFQALLDETRSSLAKQHIEAGQLALPEISFLLGFSEPSAFHRAFRRWTGTTPQAYARSRRSSAPL